MTRELIADMLGVRREGVTEAAATLPARGAMRATAQTFARSYAKLRTTNP